MAVLAKASALIARALSLMNESNTQIISYQDKKDTINEAFKDVYNKLIESDDDYIFEEVLITVAPGDATGYPNNEKYVALPDRCFKIRTLDYQAGSLWAPIQKFPLEVRDDSTSEPMYRLLGKDLWIIGGLTGWTGQLRLRYYPPADVITLPDTPLLYGTTRGPSGIALMTAPFYVKQRVYSAGGKQVAADVDWILYAYNGTGLTAETIQGNNAPILLYTGATPITNIVAYKGYIYFLMGGKVYKGLWDFGSSAIVPAAIGAEVGIVAFTIQNDTIYIANATQTKSMDLAGGTVVVLLASPVTSYQLLGADTYYITASGDLQRNAALFLHNIAAAANDGTYIYVLDTAKNLRRITLGLAGAIAADDTLYSGASKLGNVASGRASLLYGDALTVEADSLELDYAWTYPHNITYELMAHQMAVDFATKRKDSDLVAILGPRLGDIGKRFMSTFIRRDEHKNQRINNFYRPRGNW